MGQKIHPHSFRFGVSRNWPSRWFLADKQVGSARSASPLKSYQKFLQEDEAIRRVVMATVAQAGIAGIEIDRTSAMVKVIIRAARPGFIIGRGGKGIEDLNLAIEKALTKLRGKKAKGISIDVEELKRTDVSAAYEAQQIVWDIEKRMPFRQIMRKRLESIMQNKEVKGAKIFLSGRLDGAEIARQEWKSSGSLPLQTLRSDVDYFRATAFTSYGTVGVKVWVYKGEVFERPTALSANNQDSSRGPSNNRRLQ